MKDSLVIGADSRIGGAVIERLAKDGAAVSGTTRRSGKASGDVHFLDLDTPFDVASLPPARSCLIAAAVTSLQACQDDPRKTRSINVDAAIRLAAGLAERGCYSLLLSTNQVFAGDSAFPGESAPVRPVNAYGKQKAEAERGVLDLAADTAVLRLSKVMDTLPGLFLNWRRSLERDEPIEAFFDMVFAPLSMDFTVDTVCRLLKGREAGVFHASGDADLSYYLAAQLLADRLGVDRRLVKEVSAHDAGLGFAAPETTALGMKRLHDRLGVAPPSSRDTIEKMLNRVLAAD